MTTTEIKAQCDEILREDAKATPGPWVADVMSSRFVWPRGTEGDKIIKLYTGNDFDQKMITKSRSFSPRAAKALMLAIDGLERSSACADPWLNRQRVIEVLEAMRKEFER